MSGRTMSHGPSRISTGIALGASGVAGLTGLGGAGWWVLLAPLGVVVVIGGLWRGQPRILAIGCAGLVSAAFVTGLAGGQPVRLVIAVAAAFVAWDLGERAIVLGEQLGRRAETWRLEFLHAGAAVTVATGGVGTVYLLFLLAGGGRPLLALILLLVGSISLLTALRWN